MAMPLTGLTPLIRRGNSNFFMRYDISCQYDGDTDGYVLLYESSFYSELFHIRANLKMSKFWLNFHAQYCME